MPTTAPDVLTQRRHLERWHTPPEMHDRAQRMMRQLGALDLFTRSGVGFLREAWVAAKLANCRNAAAVRLIGDDRPDFVIRFNDGTTELYELVEAQGDRKRGDEYRTLAAAGWPIINIPAEEWAAPQQAFNAAHAAAATKARKAEALLKKGIPYPPQTRLLLYLNNLWDFGVHTAEIVAVLPRAVEPARAWFTTVWVLWNDCIYQV